MSFESRFFFANLCDLDTVETILAWPSVTCRNRLQIALATQRHNPGC